MLKLGRAIQHYDFIAVSERWNFAKQTSQFDMVSRACDGSWRIGEAGAPIESFPVGLIGSERLHSSADYIRRFDA